VEAPAGSSPAPPRLFDPLEQFLAGQLSERTRRAYLADLCHFSDNADVQLDDIRAVHFQAVVAFRIRLAAEGYKRSSINRKLSSLKSFFRLMVAARVIEQSPADSALVRGYRLEEQLTGKAIHQKALRQILAAVAEVEDELVRTRDTALVFLLTYGGLRRSEAAMACWEDLRQEGPFYLLTLPQTTSGVPQDIKLQPVVVHHLNAYPGGAAPQRLPGHRPDTAGFVTALLRPAADRSVDQYHCEALRPEGRGVTEGHGSHVPAHLLHLGHRGRGQTVAGAGASAAQGPEDHDALLREPRAADGQRVG
jgi:integrase